MICIELAFTPDPARLAARPAHRRRLADLHARGVLVAAGPWADDSGALLILATDRAGADAVLAADPYVTTAGVRVVAVRDWAPLLAPVPAASAPPAGSGRPPS
ncbi:YciI family protein [Pseudonocardia humida]|uniref:YCII-related domain-containing protein n=1 Tax=Pseudonocardia humida TaxID=2800819 RepID=A0ABT1A8W8_9PSEU|nr:YciI family protein [Pseudonocardia humida]MCO1659472.1 hypothetical protein [Pseudonocardia humida]